MSSTSCACSISCRRRAAASARAARSSTPSSSAASSSSGTSAAVQPPSGSRRSRSASTSDSPAATIRSPDMSSSARNRCGVRVGHSSSSASSTASWSPSCVLSRSRSSSPATPASDRPAPDRSPRSPAYSAATAATNCSTNTGRASLCGRRVRRAAVRARRIAAAGIRTRSPSTTSTSAPSGTRCRSLTAVASTSAIAGRPLISATSSGSGPVRGDAREQAGDRCQHHGGLAERRQHVADVAQERRVGPDHQHAAPLQLLPVGVEQVGGAVQRDRGLAGAGAALHDQHAAVRGADHVVLLGLDGRDDVGHPAGPGGAEGGQQRRLAGRSGVPGGVRIGEVEHLVVDPGHLAQPGADVPAPADALRPRPRWRRRTAAPRAPASPAATTRSRPRRRRCRAGRRTGARRPRGRADRSRARSPRR